MSSEKHGKILNRVVLSFKVSRKGYTVLIKSKSDPKKFRKTVFNG